MNPEILFAVAGLITAAAVTPGPNNFIVLERTLRGGFLAGIPAIAGVALGTQLLLLVVWFGAGALFQEEPRLREALTIMGAGYLLWIGLQVVWKSFASTREGGTATLASVSSFAGLALFQFLNPKSWVLVLTAAAAMSGTMNGLTALAALATLFLTITIACLLIWAALGAGLTRFLANPARSRWFDRGMGSLLMVSAGLLLI